MPSPLTYPGVYIEEIPSGVHTITGVATSITAFVGRAARGPTDDDPLSPVTIHGFPDFQRIFGGLWKFSRLGYAVKDFFLNGGSTALIVRLHKNGQAAKLPLPTGSAAPNDVLPLIAANVGKWADNLKVTVDHLTKDTTNTNLFNLTVVELDAVTGKAVRVEKFLNVSIDSADARYVPRVLVSGSSLVRVDTNNATGAWIVPNVTPQDGDVTPNVAGGDGTALDQNSFTGPGKEDAKQGLYALKRADLFNLLCIPPYLDDDNVDAGLMGTAAAYCEEKARAMLLVDPHSDWNTSAQVVTAMGNAAANVGTTSKNAALFFPRIVESDPLLDNQLATFAPCGAIAGIFARTDAQRGVWKAPAGLEAGLVAVSDFSVNLTDLENGDLNQLGVNCLRLRPAAGPVVWGSRTLQGDDRLASEWKYIPVRRTALFIEESLYRGTQWVVFEPNDESLWAQIRLNVGAFMHNLFRQGAFQGKSPKDAYFVKCDAETTTQNDIDLGIVNIVVGFAPLKPVEFVVIQIQQMAGQIQT